jgi:hypothetical protein
MLGLRALGRSWDEDLERSSGGGREDMMGGKRGYVIFPSLALGHDKP